MESDGKTWKEAGSSLGAEQMTKMCAIWKSDFSSVHLISLHL